MMIIKSIRNLILLGILYVGSVVLSFLALHQTYQTFGVLGLIALFAAVVFALRFLFLRAMRKVRPPGGEH